MLRRNSLKRVHQTLTRVIQRRIVEVFAKLVLFRTSVMVQGEYGGLVLAAGQAQVNSGFTAVTANLQHRPPVARLQGVLVKRGRFIVRKKALDVIDIAGKVGDHVGNVLIIGWAK